MQINASKSALLKVSQITLEGDLNHCVKERIENGDSDQTIENLTKAVEYFARL